MYMQKQADYTDVYMNLLMHIKVIVTQNCLRFFLPTVFYNAVNVME